MSLNLNLSTQKYLVLEKKQIPSVDDPTKFGVYNPTNKSSKLIKDKVKNISKIVKDLKRIKNG